MGTGVQGGYIRPLPVRLDGPGEGWKSTGVTSPRLYPNPTLQRPVEPLGVGGEGPRQRLRFLPVSPKLRPHEQGIGPAVSSRAGRSVAERANRSSRSPQRGSYTLCQVPEGCLDLCQGPIGSTGLVCQGLSHWAWCARAFSHWA